MPNLIITVIIISFCIILFYLAWKTQQKEWKQKDKQTERQMDHELKIKEYEILQKAIEAKQVTNLKQKDHIHTWNEYIDGKLCCSNCGMAYTYYLSTNKNILEIGGEKSENKRT